jgi:hypothetical protein
MKKVLIGLGVIVVLIGGGVFYVLSNLDDIVKSAIETYGTAAVGSEVRVGSVAISLSNGSASIYDFSIANPVGFSDKAMVSFSELSVVLDLANLSGENIAITSITSTDPFVSYERANGTTNLDVVSQRLAGEGPQEPENAGAESDIRMQIGAVNINNIQASISDDRLPAPANVSLGNINLQNMSGTPAEITQQILSPLLRQLAANAARAFVNLANDLLSDSAETIRDTMDNLQETVDENLGENIREGLGNLFGN